MIFEDENKKEFVCKQCFTFLNSEDLRNGKCPKCDTDEDLFINDLNNDDDYIDFV